MQTRKKWRLLIKSGKPRGRTWLRPLAIVRSIFIFVLQLSSRIVYSAAGGVVRIRRTNLIKKSAKGSCSARRVRTSCNLIRVIIRTAVKFSLRARKSSYPRKAHFFDIRVNKSHFYITRRTKSCTITILRFHGYLAKFL